MSVALNGKGPLAAASAEERVFAHFRRFYGVASMDEVEVDAAPGYWRRKQPCDPATCRSRYHTSPGCENEPVRHTLFFAEPQSFEGGRILSRYRAWEDLRARNVLRRTPAPRSPLGPSPESQAASSVLESPAKEAPAPETDPSPLNVKEAKQAWQRASVSARFTRLKQYGIGPPPESPQARGWYLPTAWKSWEALPADVREALITATTLPAHSDGRETPDPRVNPPAAVTP